MTTAIVTPYEELERARWRNRLARLLADGVPMDRAVRIVSMLRAADMQSRRAQAKSEAIEGTPIVRPSSKRRLSESAVDRLARRIKDFLRTRSSEQAHRIAVETAQQTK